MSSCHGELYFDGASHTETNPNGTLKKRAGAGLVFKTPQGETICHSFSLLKEECSNNEAEYEALIFGLLLALSMDIQNLQAYGDSQLVVRQINDVYEVRKPELGSCTDDHFLRCVSRKEVDQILQEMHHGVCGGHQGGAKMYHRIRLAGYYWPKIMADCLKTAKSCHNCQIHGDFKHQSLVPLHPTVPSWPFNAWGIDVIGSIEPPSSQGHHYILAATDYFSKWAEAVPLWEVKTDNVIQCHQLPRATYHIPFWSSTKYHL